MFVDSETVFGQISVSSSGVKPQGWVGASGPLLALFVVRVCCVITVVERRGSTRCSRTIYGEFSVLLEVWCREWWKPLSSLISLDSSTVSPLRTLLIPSRRFICAIPNLIDRSRRSGCIRAFKKVLKTNLASTKEPRDLPHLWQAGLKNVLQTLPVNLRTWKLRVCHFSWSNYEYGDRPANPRAHPDPRPKMWSW